MHKFLVPLAREACARRVRPDAFGMPETAAFRAWKAQDAIEWFHGIGRQVARTVRNGFEGPSALPAWARTVSGGRRSNVTAECHKKMPFIRPGRPDGLARSSNAVDNSQKTD